MSSVVHHAAHVPTICYRGEVVYLFAYDIAYEMGREPIRELLGQPVSEYHVDPSRRTPRHRQFFKQQMVKLPTQARIGPHGPIDVGLNVKFLSVGAISIQVRVPFAVPKIEDLVAYHDLQFHGGSLHDEVRQLAEKVRAELSPYFLRPIDRMNEEEAYTVFCFESPVQGDTGAPQRAEVWLDAHRREVAALLAQENDHAKLSRQEALESTNRNLSYYEDDLVVVDWDAALVVDDPREWEETLYVLELANLQLAELEAYDQLLDEALDRSYRDLGQRPARRRGVVLRELRELRIDMARFSDELSNISKFFGDWHLARLYELVASRFHLADWHRTVDSKLKTLGELYELLKHDQTNRWMVVLEFTIVLLFIIDLALLFIGLG
jgi:hypothetical protein